MRPWWEAYTKPVPYIVLACCHWLSVAGLHTEGIFRSEGSRQSVERLVAKFQRNPTSLVPVVGGLTALGCPLFISTLAVSVTVDRLKLKCNEPLSNFVALWFQLQLAPLHWGVRSRGRGDSCQGVSAIAALAPAHLQPLHRRRAERRGRAPPASCH